MGRDAEAIATGAEIAQEEIEAGIQTAEEIKAAAAIEALKVLVQAQLIKEEATREAVATLVSAAMLKQASADDTVNMLVAASRQRRLSG